MTILVLLQIPQCTHCAVLSASPQLQTEVANYLCLANSDCLVITYFWVLCLLCRLSGTSASCPVRGTVSHSSLAARLIPWGLVIQRTSVFSLSSSCLDLKTCKPYAENSYESKYAYAGFRISQIYLRHLHSLPPLCEFSEAC